MKATSATAAASLLLIAALLAARSGVAQAPQADQPPPGANALSADDDKAIRQVIRGVEETSWACTGAAGTT